MDSDGDSYRIELIVFDSNTNSNTNSDADCDADSGINYNNAYKVPA